MDGEQRKGKGRQIGGVGRGRVSIPDGSGALGLCRSHILKNKRGRHPPQQRHTGRSPPGPPDPSCRHSPSSSPPPPLHGGCSSPGWPGGAAMGSNTKLRTWCGVRINRQMTNHRSPLVTWLHPSLSLKSLLGQKWGLFRGEHGKGHLLTISLHSPNLCSSKLSLTTPSLRPRAGPVLSHEGAKS